MKNRLLLATSLCAGGLITALVMPALALPDYTCGKEFKIKEVWKAKSGDFEISEGLSVKKVSGVVGRTKASLNGCLIDASAGDSYLVAFDGKQKSTFARGSDFEMQCVDAKEPNGKFLGKMSAPTVRAADYSWIAPCEAKDLSAAEKKTCAESASRNDRRESFKKMAKKNNAHYLEFNVRSDPFYYSRSEESLVSGASGRHKASEVAPSGKVFCQYFHRPSKKVVFATTFDIPK